MDTRQSLRKEIDDAALGIVRRVNAIEDKAVEIKDSFSVAQHVQENPWRALGASVALGFLLTSIFTR